MRKYNNRDRICETALELFNSYGYGSVTTNQIAAELDISPGNLYYHFRNKEEIMEAVYKIGLDHIQEEADIPADLVLTPERCAYYFSNSMRMFWRYRSLFGDLEEIARHPPLAVAQHDLVQWCNAQVVKLYELLGAQDRLRRPVPSHETLTIVATNTALILTGWWRFLNMAYDPRDLTLDSLRLGAIQGYFPIDPYLKPKFALAVREAITKETLSDEKAEL